MFLVGVVYGESLLLDAQVSLHLEIRFLEVEAVLLKSLGLDVLQLFGFYRYLLLVQQFFDLHTECLDSAKMILNRALQQLLCIFRVRCIFKFTFRWISVFAFSR